MSEHIKAILHAEATPTNDLCPKCGNLIRGVFVDNGIHIGEGATEIGGSVYRCHKCWSLLMFTVVTKPCKNYAENDKTET